MTAITRSPGETEMLGAALARGLGPGAVVALVGPLGAGKSCLARGIVRGMGHRGLVPSPSFTLLREYEGRLPVYHFDVYRLDGEEELLLLGFDEYLSAGGVVIVEWADRVSGALPDRRLDVAVSRPAYAAPNERRIEMAPLGDEYRALVGRLDAERRPAAHGRVCRRTRRGGATR